MLIKAILAMISLGVISGFVSGFIGAGTGVILVPMLVWYLHHCLHYDLATALIESTSTSIAIMTISSFFNYYFRRNDVQIDKSLIIKLLVLIILTACIGVMLRGDIPVYLYKMIIGGLLIYFAIKIIWQAHAKGPPKPITRSNIIAFYCKCAFIYTMSVISGTGTGKMMIPVFRSIGIDRATATAMSKPLAVFNCLIISLLVIFHHNINTTHVQYSLGSIYMVGFLVISITSIVPMWYGIAVSEKMKSHFFDYIFSIFLFFSALMIFLMR